MTDLPTREEVIDWMAIGDSGAPFPSARSLTKARHALNSPALQTILKAAVEALEPFANLDVGLESGSTSIFFHFDPGDFVRATRALAALKGLVTK